MKVYNNIDEFEGCVNAVVTTGTFDGVHIGHQKILSKLSTVAKEIDGETVLLTFHPHPRLVLQPDDNDLKLINTIEERVNFLSKQGIDHLIIHPFSKEFSRLTSVEFVRDILVNKLGTKKLVIGYNHHFGRNREGSFEHLIEYGPLYGFDVEEIPAQDVKDINVSSTKIRNAILDGKMDIANQYLGHNFTLSGIVTKGNQIGRKIGFPTANLSIEKHKILPHIGVYAVDVAYNKTYYKGMLNIGIRPTIHNNDSLTAEVNIFDFNEEIYGEKIVLSVKKRLRNEQKFDTIDLLKRELNADKIMALNC
ncbi:MAG: bifunctional riboflavin kinase/FAD synthetase [Flavobacteriales bacterium]|nr:bifunctional riboflavin kinase/FAD synthetase [Flavobacteriales bacterium]